MRFLFCWRCFLFDGLSLTDSIQPAHLAPGRQIYYCRPFRLGLWETFHNKLSGNAAMQSISFSKKLMWLLLKGPSGQTATRVRRAWVFTDIEWAGHFWKKRSLGRHIRRTPTQVAPTGQAVRVMVRHVYIVHWIHHMSSILRLGPTHG